MEEYQKSDAVEEAAAWVLSFEAVEAVARSLYGEGEYDSLPSNDQVKDAYRKRARALLKLAVDAAKQPAADRH